MNLIFLLSNHRTEYEVYVCVCVSLPAKKQGQRPSSSAREKERNAFRRQQMYSQGACEDRKLRVKHTRIYAAIGSLCTVYML